VRVGESGIEKRILTGEINLTTLTTLTKGEFLVNQVFANGLWSIEFKVNEKTDPGGVATFNRGARTGHSSFHGGDSYFYWAGRCSTFLKDGKNQIRVAISAKTREGGPAPYILGEATQWKFLFFGESDASEVRKFEVASLPSGGHVVIAHFRILDTTDLEKEALRL
jgi:hypothetical protein